MSYPEPIEYESQERLYKQARFFYDEYERVNKEKSAYEDLIKDLEKIITDEINKCSAGLFKLSNTPDTTKLYDLIYQRLLYDLAYQRLDDFKELHLELSGLRKKYLED